MKTPTDSSTTKQIVPVGSTQGHKGDSRIFSLRGCAAGLAGWSTGTFTIPFLNAHASFVLPAATLFRLLVKHIGSCTSQDTEQIDLRERCVGVFSSSADGFLPLLFLNRRRNTAGWTHLSFSEGRVLNVTLPSEKRCGYAGLARLSRRQPAGAEFFLRGVDWTSSPAHMCGIFGRSRESRLIFLARITDRKGERDRENGLVRLSLSSPEQAVRIQMLCQSLGLNTRFTITGTRSVLEIPPSPAFLRYCESEEIAAVDNTGQDTVRTARFSDAVALPLPGRDDSYEFVVDGEGYDINGVEVQG